MFQRNLKDGRQYSYFSIQFAEGAWVAWFYEDLLDNFNGKIKEILTEGGDGNV